MSDPLSAGVLVLGTAAVVTGAAVDVVDTAVAVQQVIASAPVEDVGSAVAVALSSCRSRRSAVIVSVSSVIRSSDVTLTPIVRTASPDTKYFETEASGTRTWSSGLLNPAPPFGWRIPITWNGRPSISAVSVSETSAFRAEEGRRIMTRT